jgi:hypothetical protein
MLPPSFSHRSSIFFFSRFLSTSFGIVVFLTFSTDRHDSLTIPLCWHFSTRPAFSFKTGDNSCKPRVKTLSLSGCVTNTIHKT